MDDFKVNTKLIATLSSVLYVPPSDIMNASGITSTTWYRIMQQPDIITIQQLLGIANGMHIPVSRFFYTGSTLLLGHRDDYITEPYLECYYDPEALQEYVASNDGATWMQAAKIIGVSRDNLRNSLLGTRRTPVTRFLQVCNIFGTNPFMYLVDPNPETTTKSGGSKPGQASFIVELKKIRQDVTKLSATVADLSRKYDKLLEQLEELSGKSRREVHVHIVAEDIPDPTPDD